LRNTGFQLFKYLLLPALIGLFLILGYFYGPAWLRQVIAPEINREYGLLENLQVVFLLAIILLAAKGVLREKTSAEKIILSLLMAVGIFVLLEEIDYGLHYYRLLIGRPLVDRYADRYINIHNIGNNTSIIKHIADSGMILLFVVLPCLLRKSKNPLVRYFRPSCYFILSMITMFSLSKFAHHLNHTVPIAGSLANSVSEFRELFIYYIFMIYLHDLTCRRPPPAGAGMRPGNDYPLSVKREGLLIAAQHVMAGKHDHTEIAD
jgi:hypothetical protein